MIMAIQLRRMLCGHKDRRVEGMEQGTNVPGDKHIRIDPDDFVEASVEQLHNGLWLYVPAATILQAIRLQSYLRVRAYPSKKCLVGNRIEQADRHAGTVKTQAPQEQLEARLAFLSVLCDADSRLKEPHKRRAGFLLAS